MTSIDTLFKPNWSCLTTGSKVSLVIDNLVWGNTAGLGKVVPGGEKVRVSGLIPAEAFGVERVTVIGGTFLSASPMVDLELDDSCDVLCHSPVLHEQLFNLVEVCAGVGLSSVGLVRAGFNHCCAVELQPKLAELHRMLHNTVPVVCADITDEAVASQVFKHCPHPGVVMAGVACQPYSRGGLQQGEDDSRSGTLPGTLRFVHLMQSPTLIIECVAPAQSSEFVQLHLRALTDQLGYRIVQCTMKLEDVWAAHRFRWWVVATHPLLGEISIPAFPAVSPLHVRDLMPYVKRWPEDDEKQLMLTQHEIDRFGFAGQPLRSYAVKPDAKLPTALHSWGGQTQACACECRQQGFSDGLLNSKGIYAQLVQLPSHDANPGAWRHLHVLEVALLNGVPLTLPWGPNQRLNLCAIGQMAAPIHALWVGSALAGHIQQLFTCESPVAPVQMLNELKRELFAQARDMYPAHADPCQSLSPVCSKLGNPRSQPWMLTMLLWSLRPHACLMTLSL